MYIVQFLCNIAFRKATDFRLKLFLICHFVKSNCVYEKLKQNLKIYCHQFWYCIEIYKKLISNL